MHRTFLPGTLLAPVLLVLASTPAMTQAPAASSIAIINGRVWTGDPSRPWAEAVSIVGDRIVVVGSNSDIRSRKLAADSRVIDAHGGMVVPGFIDSHVHFLSGGMNL
ncbi:MAG: amidohydrolase family protein, partial [Gemmatimonadaceae bacterium]